MANEYLTIQQEITTLIADLGTRGKIANQEGKNASGYVVLVNQVQRDRDGTTERRDTKTMYFQGKLTFSPQTGDIVTVGRNTYAVVTADNYTPDNATNCAWKLEVTS